MLFLAQVQKNATSNDLELKLLASQTTDAFWELMPVAILPMATPADFSVGHLVLLELGERREIHRITLANDWLLGILQRYLKYDITPEFVATEKARVEKWRQALTAQSQDLTRRNLEMETRREQLQELEANLQREKEHFSQRWQDLEAREAKLQERLQDQYEPDN